MDPVKKRELLIGAIMLGAGLVYLFLTMQLPRRGPIDAAFVPYLLAAFMCLLGTLQLAVSWKMPAGAMGADEPPTGGADYLTVGKTLGLIVLYIALLETVGFPIVTVLYLYLQFIVLTPVSEKIGHLRYLVIAAVASTAIYLVFRYGFDLMLPAGPIDFIG